MDELDRVVRTAALPMADATGRPVADTLDALRDAIRSDGHPASRRQARVPRRRRTLAWAVAVAIAVAAPVTAATVIAAHTGHFASGGGEEGSGEFIRLDSPQFPAVLDHIRRRESLRLPPGEDWSALRGRFAVDGASVMTTSGIAQGVEDYARCAWLGAYLDGARRGDAAAQNHAATVLGEVPRWPQMSRQTDPTFQRVLRAEAAAAADGRTGDAASTTFDAGNIARDYAVNCTTAAVGG